MARPFRAYSERELEYVVSFPGDVVRMIRYHRWYLHCRRCDTHEYIGHTPHRAHDWAGKHALFFHVPIRLPVGVKY